MEIQALESVLAQHPFFDGLPQGDLQLLTGCASNVRFEPGSFIFQAGEPANHFFLIREGKVSLELYTPSRQAIPIETLGADDLLGWSWLFPPYQWHFDARAVERTRAFQFDGRCLREKFEQNHDLGYRMVMRFAAVIVQRLQATRMQLLDLYETEPSL